MSGVPQDSAPLARLLGLVSAPARRVPRLRAGPAHADLVLPSDFGPLIEAYGDGLLTDGVDRRLELLSPPWIPNGRMLSHTAEMTAIRQDWFRSDDVWARVARDRWAYSDWPQPGGLLAWGELDERVTLWWRTVGAPDLWITVAHDAENFRTVELPYTATEAVVRLIDGSIADPLLGRRWATPVRFEPWTGGGT